MKNSVPAKPAAFSIDSNVTNLFMQFPAMVCILEGPSFLVTYANPLFRKLYEGRELVGKTVREMIPDLQAKGYFELLERVYKSGEPAFGFADAAEADWNQSGHRSTKYFDFVYSPYKIEEQTIGVIAFGLDVTQQVTARQEADRQQTLINTISKASPTCLWICDADMHCIFVNETWTRWTGKPLGAHLGTGWSTSLVEEDRKAAYDAFSVSYQGKSNYEHEYRVVCADGSVKWCLSSGRPWYHPDGSFGGFAGSATDITERKQEEKRIKTMVDALPLMAWTAKPDGELDYFNKRWYEYTGQPVQEAFGTGWAKTMPPDTEASVFAKWNHALKNGVPYETECRYRRYDGEYRWHIARAEPIKNEAGEILYWLGTSTDIHDQKTLSDLLERKVQERTNDLINANLALLRSNEDLERFASVASHDLKEPLRKIQVFSDLLQQPSNSNKEATVRKIRDASNRMMSLIDSLLEFSSLNRSGDNWGQVDLNGVLEEVKHDLELLIQERNVQITSAQLPVVRGLGHQLTQLFANLVSNAIKYSKPDEPPRVDIACRMASTEEVSRFNTLDTRQPFYSIQIQDNGIGFAQNEAEKIFAIFQRLHSRETYAGTGVGLAVCRKVAQNHGGEISASSQPGIGSTFTILLPAK